VSAELRPITKRPSPEPETGPGLVETSGVQEPGNAPGEALEPQEFLHEFLQIKLQVLDYGLQLLSLVPQGSEQFNRILTRLADLWLNLSE
jgi:hypothetical protein